MRTKNKIYRLLIEGKTASQISEKLNIDKGYVSRIIRQLERGGYIHCVNPKGKPKFYEKTEKSLNRSKLTILTPDKLTRLSHRLEIEVQKSTFMFNIIIPPKQEKWDKEYKWNRVQVQQYSHPFKNFGDILFRRFKSKNKDQLLIILPRILIDKNNIENAERILTEYAIKAGAWIQKRFKMRLGLPEICQKPHFAVPAREPEVIDALKKTTLKVGDIMADSSPPSCIPEIESTDHRDVINYLDAINKIKHIEDILQKQRELLFETIEKMDLIAENQKQLIKITAMLSNISNLKEYDQETINRMFG